MAMISIVIGFVLGGLALAYVLYPLYRRLPAEVKGNAQTQMMASSSNEPVQTEREQTAKTALQEIELDYQLGNLAEGDYRTLRERYMRRALVELKLRYDQEQDFDALIEEKLRQMRENEKETDE